MKGPIIELTAITKGPCETCKGNTWAYRVVETHLTISFSRTYKWCASCVANYAQEFMVPIHDRLKDKIVSFEKKEGTD